MLLVDYPENENNSILIQSKTIFQDFATQSLLEYTSTQSSLDVKISRRTFNTSVIVSTNNVPIMVNKMVVELMRTCQRMSTSEL